MRKLRALELMVSQLKNLPLKRRLSAFLFMLLILLTIAFIWSNSLQNSQESLKRSDFVVELIEPVILAIPVPKWHSPDMMSFITRKLGHFSEFFLLGIELMILKFLLEPAVKIKFWHLIIFASLIALTDEGIQLTNGRGAMLQDVILDSFGALTGIGVVSGIYNLLHRAHRKVIHD
ncbi:MAG: VanZ family protein [Clostridiales bacterium]|jgi:VanZ family protein|nr:VanZ family protein [Clostridiales bacterium]